jgi:hypothetical protein
VTKADEFLASNGRALISGSRSAGLIWEYPAHPRVGGEGLTFFDTDRSKQTEHLGAEGRGRLPVDHGPDLLVEVYVVGVDGGEGTARQVYEPGGGRIVALRQRVDPGPGLEVR